MPDPVYFPQINSNLILTQLPYTAGLAFESVAQDMETGMRYTFPRRGIGLDGYPASPLGRFGITFSCITDAEVDALQVFFRSMRGKWGTFRLLDPGGNLVRFSEDFSQTYWDKSTGPVTVGANVQDPFGGNLATQLSAGGGDTILKGQITPDDGGMMGVRVCISMWVNVRDAGTNLFVGFMDEGGTKRGTTFTNLPFERWIRIFHSETLWDQGKFRAIMGGNTTWASTRQIYTFGFQVSPTKGEGAYVRTPENYGYHENCRFDTDAFERRCVGPNENSVSLPIVEFMVAPPEEE